MGNREIFDSMAERYDSPERVVIAELIAGEMRAALGDMPGKRAIDYGCGTGLIGFALIDLFASLLFVDASPRMIERVERKIEETHSGNARALCCDFAEGLPPGERADVLLASQVLLHVREIEPLLRRFAAVLAPGGRLLIADFDKNEKIRSDKVHNGFVQSTLVDACARAGFASARAHTFYEGQKIFLQQDASLFLLQADKAR